MHRRTLPLAMAFAFSLSVAGSLHAAPLALFRNEGKATSAARMVSFAVRNDAQATLMLKSGDQLFTIQPGKTAKMKLAEGAEVIYVNGTSKQAAGSVLTRVGKQLQGNTLAVS